MAKRKRTTRKIKKKIWYEIYAPKVLNENFIEQTPAKEDQSIVGRRVRVNLMTLTNNIKNQHINLIFTIKETIGTKAKTSFFGYELSNSYLRRIVREGIKRIDSSRLYRTKDNITLRLKVLLIVNGKIKSSVAKVLRRRMLGYLYKYFRNHTFDEFTSELIKGKLQDGLKNELKTTYPIYHSLVLKSYLEKPKRKFKRKQKSNNQNNQDFIEDDFDDSSYNPKSKKTEFKQNLNDETESSKNKDNKLDANKDNDFDDEQSKDVQTQTKETNEEDKENNIQNKDISDQMNQNYEESNASLKVKA